MKKKHETDHRGMGVGGGGGQGRQARQGELTHSGVGAFGGAEGH